ncbi:FtsX-like permease family protein [Dermacoccaceae bacterium W4C1]
MRAAIGLGRRLAVTQGRFWIVLICSAIAAGLAGYGLGFVGRQADVLLAAGATDAFTDRNLRLFLGVIVLLPAVVLAASTGRLSSGVRDRRGQALALLGLDRQGRAVSAAVELGIPAVIGAVLGATLCQLSAVTLGTDAPGAVGWLVAVAIPMVTSAAAASSVVRGPRATRRERLDTGVRIWWRIAALVLGVVICAWVLRNAAQAVESERLMRVWIVGMVMLALGVVSVAPVLVVALARVLTRRAGSAGRLVLGRRLAAHPAGSTRVVAALMIAVFVAVGGGWVVAMVQDFTARSVSEEARGERVPVWADPAVVAQVRQNASADDRVARVSQALPLVRVVGADGYSVQGIVGTCTDLARLADDIANCHDAPVQRIGQGFVGERSVRAESLPVPAREDGRAVQAALPSVDPQTITLISTGAVPEPGYLISPRVPGLDAVLADTGRTLVVQARPGVRLTGLTSDSAGTTVEWGMSPVMDSDLALAEVSPRIGAVLTLVVLAMALGGVAAGLLDRAAERRRELSSLRALGVSERSLLRTQWWEGFAPAALGLVLAVLAGALAGGSYLRLVRAGGGSGVSTDAGAGALQNAAAVAGIGLLSALVMAGIGVLVSRTSPTPARLE